jgi:hypothetical protein
MLSTATNPNPHEDCYLSEHCGAADCPAARRDRERAAARARLGAPEWSKLVPPTHSGRGFDTYWHLDGEHISCGTCLELQSVDWPSDSEGDQFIVYLSKGVRVRWEIDHVFDPKAPGNTRRVPVLHGVIGGHSFTTGLDESMRFRWPARGGR